MKKRFFLIFWLLVLLSLPFATVGSVLAQDAPPPPAPALAPGGSLGPYRQHAAAARAAGKPDLSAQAAWDGSEWEPPARVSAQAADGFGYASKNVALNWLDITQTGTAVEFPAEERIVSIDLPFAFKFYDNTYTSVRLSQYGYLTFSSYPGAELQSGLLVPTEPNNVIAPYWTPVNIDLHGQIYTASGGEAPARYVVFEWQDVSDNWASGDTSFTFEVILYENGNIRFQYLDMLYDADPSYHAAGIEDSTGATGLVILKNPARQKSNRAVLITRPTAQVALKLYPAEHGALAGPDGPAFYRLKVKNAGEAGSDTYDLRVSSRWPWAALQADGITPLTDTDGDRKIDTGPLSPGETAEVVIRVTPPLTAKVGESKTASVTLTSSLKSTRRKTAVLTTTVPAAFTQTYINDCLSSGVDVAAGNFLPQEGQTHFTLSAGVGGRNPSAARMASGSGVYAWSQYVCPEENCERVYYSITALDGTPRLAPTALASPSEGTWDYAVKVAAAPNGTIGLVFIRETRHSYTGSILYNVYFTLLDANGEVKIQPVNLTGNNSSDVEFYDPEIVAGADSTYTIAFVRYTSQNLPLSNIYLAVYDGFGAQLRAPAPLTADPGYDGGYYSPSLAVLNGGRVLVAYNGWKPRGSSWTEYAFYAVYEADGSTVRPETGIALGSVDSFGMDSVQMTSGQVLMAWGIEKGGRESITYAVLKDGTYAKAKGPAGLAIPAAVTGGYYVSVTRDETGRGIITWADDYRAFGRHLYYTLVGKNGALLTKPTIFMTAAENCYVYMRDYGSSSMPYPLPSPRP